MRCLGRRFAFSQEPILVCGESGTGKELVAQALHMASQRSDRPFVTVNCAALPPELMESELFGYETGAFTGAKVGGVKGKFEMADTGTIFLDEIGELPLPMQAKLLRVLETGEIQKIAHKGQLHSDFRLIGATNRNLAEMVRQGQFREDLYHRLSVFELDIPPLRDRVSDISSPRASGTIARRISGLTTPCMMPLPNTRGAAMSGNSRMYLCTRYIL